MAKYVVSYKRAETGAIVTRYVDSHLDAIRVMENITSDNTIRTITNVVFDNVAPSITKIDEYGDVIQLAKRGYEDMNTLQLITI